MFIIQTGQPTKLSLQSRVVPLDREYSCSIVIILTLLLCVEIKENRGEMANTASIVRALFAGRLFHWYMLGESICHLRGVESILSLLFYF